MPNKIYQTLALAATISAYPRPETKFQLPEEITNINWARKKIANSQTTKTYDQDFFNQRSLALLKKCGHGVDPDPAASYHGPTYQVSRNEMYDCLMRSDTWVFRTVKKYYPETLEASIGQFVNNLFMCGSKRPKVINGHSGFDRFCMHDFLTLESLPDRLIFDARVSTLVFLGPEKKSFTKKELFKRIEHFNKQMGIKNWFLRMLLKPFISNEVSKTFKEYDMTPTDGFLDYNELFMAFTRRYFGSYLIQL